MAWFGLVIEMKFELRVVVPRPFGAAALSPKIYNIYTRVKLWSLFKCGGAQTKLLIIHEGNEPISVPYVANLFDHIPIPPPPPSSGEAMKYLVARPTPRGSLEARDVSIFSTSLLA
jgi:hypothetical protein